MKLRVVTPVRPIVDCDASEIVAPGSEGEFGVLPAHVTFLGALRPGVLRYVVGGETRKVVVSGGYAEVRQDTVTVLADGAERPEEIDGVAARADRDRLHGQLASGAESAERTEELLRELALAEARIAVASA